MSLSADIVVRPYRADDAGAVSEICYLTGYMGESAQGHFCDRELFALLWAYSNIAYSPKSCFVAVSESKVVGYCLVAADTKDFGRWLLETHKRAIIKRTLSSTMWRSPKDLGWLFRWNRPAKPDAGLPALLESYPAHLHINVLPGVQRKGIGQILIAAAFQHLKDCRVPGVHLRTTSRNASALRFYDKIGFQRLKVSTDTLWNVPGVQHVCMGISL